MFPVPPSTVLITALTALRDNAQYEGDPCYRAFEKALKAVDRGVLHWMRSGIAGAWIIPSANAALFYVVTPMSCSCPHGQPHKTRDGSMVMANGLCWHRALCEGITLAQHEQDAAPRVGAKPLRKGGDNGRAQREVQELFTD